MAEDTVLLLGHGSRDSDAVREFSAFTEFFKKETGRSLVFPAYLELASPPIFEAIHQAVLSGAKRIFALPLFLFPGRHVLEDLPRILRDAKARFQDVEIFYGNPLDQHHAVMKLAAHRISETPPLPTPPDRTGLLVVGRGTLEPKAMDATARMAKRLQPYFSYSHVRHCFAEVSPPYLPSALDELLAAGALGVVIFPALLFTGIIIQRIERQVELLRKKHPATPIALAPYLGVHPFLVDAVQDQIPLCSPI